MIALTTSKMRPRGLQLLYANLRMAVHSILQLSFGGTELGSFKVLSKQSVLGVFIRSLSVKLDGSFLPALASNHPINA